MNNWLSPAEVPHVSRKELERAYEFARRETDKWVDALLVMTRAVKMLEQRLENLRQGSGTDT